jgi:hypothetical protein
VFSRFRKLENAANASAFSQGTTRLVLFDVVGDAPVEIARVRFGLAADRGSTPLRPLLEPPLGGKRG